MTLTKAILILALSLFGMICAHLFVSEVTARPSLGGVALTGGLGSPISYSILSRQAALRTCSAALEPSVADLRPRHEKQALITHCNNLAQSILADAPTQSNAQFVAALAAFHSSDMDAMYRHLLASQSFGAHEGWLAERRFTLAANAQLGTIRYPLFRDIATLLSTKSGVILVSKYYRNRPELRPAIRQTAVLATYSDQRRLLNVLSQPVVGQ